MAEIKPVHPQLMDPIEDPEEFIAASVYWYPLIFPTRTDVLDHTMLCNGNGYEWNDRGQICSVFAHIEPDYDRLVGYETRAREYEADAAKDANGPLADWLLEMARKEREELARLEAIIDETRALFAPLFTEQERLF